MSLLFLVRLIKVCLNSTHAPSVHNSVFSLMHTWERWDSRFVFFWGGISNISFIITGARQQDWGSAWKCSIGPRQGNHSQGYGWLTCQLRRGLNIKHSGHQTWNCAALICMYNSSISQHLSKEMRHYLKMNEQAAINNPLSYSRWFSGFSCLLHLLCHGFSTETNCWFFRLLWLVEIIIFLINCWISIISDTPDSWHN